MFSTILKWFYLLTIICVVQHDCEIYQDRPKIKSSGGDLILEPALNKNIYLRPNGPKSSIFIANVDILKTNTLQGPIQYQPATGENLDKFLNGPNGILQRLENLEKRSTTVPETTLINITMLWRKVNNLNRKVIALQTQINNRPRDECDSQPCQHGGTCLNLVDGYYCLCPSNWEGRDCDVDVNECRNFAGTDLGCQNGATCINRPGTYECLCKSGWFGLHCTTKAKDCSAGDFEMCGYGTCIPVTTGEGIKCICHQGWTTNATSVTCLTDINECESHQGPRCSVNPRVECINLPGSFRCGQCPAGYEGDGYICNDINECITTQNGGCSPLVTCHNTIGSRICGSCPPGYQGDGVTCTFRGSCNIDHGGCHTSAQCVELPTPTGVTVQCICPEGMEGDGVGFAGCYVSTRWNNFTEGCESNPCGSHGRCHRVRSGYTCICFKGYGGAHCDTSTDSCANNPCQNGGVCKQDPINGFRCECTAQYSGTLCQVRTKSCGGILDAEEGSIAFPLSNASATYNHNEQCAWVIHTAADKVINVTFSKFSVELTPDCSGDFLQIHDGRKSSNQLIGRFCGNTLPKGGNIVSSHNNLYFWFHSDRTVAKTGFILHWTSIKPICGGEIDASTHGHISSPGSPGPYPPNRDCYWHLTTTPGKRISLHFYALDIETHANCSFDYLAVYDGGHSTDPLLSKYCNSTQPAPVQTSSSDILIHFHSDAFGSGNGFQIAYAPVEGMPGCGGHFTADRGEIVSPTYNGLYLTNLLCEYQIRTGPETKIKLDFKLFKLERSFRCRYDYLKIYDGPSSDSQLVGKFCGTTYPATYTSSSNTLYLKFRTDRSMGAEGFRISYEAICSKTLIGDSGVVKSPSYPFTYPDNKVCVYVIKTVPGKAIQLTFQDFDIEDNRYYECRYDNVEIRDGPDRNSTLLGRYCGGSQHMPPAQTSTHNYLYIRFQSDMSLSGTGFYANYTTINTECGGIYRDTTGLINHPRSDTSTYNNDQSCQWILVAPEGMHIKLTWNRFELEDMPGCRSDYLELIEINDDNKNDLLGRYCGSQSPPTLTTSTNRLKLKFVSDSDVRYAGFSMSYTFLDERSHCGGNYVKSHGSIHSPGWPRSYEPNRDCTWIITVPVGQQISLNISDLDLERPVRDKCNLGDYLEIRNGGSPTSPLIGQYCGKIKSKQITSLANVLHIHFHSDFYLTGNGFNITWDGTISGCGGTLTSSTGSISSPNYPNNYHENSECFYKIVVSAGSRIRISFTEIELERTPSCRDDYVEIYDGRDTNAPSLGKHCYMVPELSNIETSTNFALIKFRSDIYIGGKGFLLNYVTICNNNLTGRYGVIESPDYPNNYPLNSRCLWNIEVPKGNKINVTFTHFDVYKYSRFRWIRYRSTFNNDDCFPDYLQMKEKDEASFSKKYCGNTLPNTVTTKTNSFQILFSSGFYAAGTGFRLEWVNYGCGGHILKQSGTVNLDRSVTTEKEMICEWLIETMPGKSISITFNEIYLYESLNCSIDAIEIYNGQNTNAPLLSKLCHNKIVTLASESNFMLIRFVKQSNLRDIHFTSRFNSVKSKCGGYIHSTSGFLYSPNYPKNYDNNQDCIWYITVPENHRIEINFIDLDLYSTRYSTAENDCRDSILIYDNNDHSPSSNYTYRICPNSNKTQIVTKYSNVIVQFKTNSHGTAKGFKANFTVTCGALISATQDGIITNNKYINHLNRSCVWSIISPNPNEKISLTLTHIALPKDTDVITNRNCPSAYLRILDGNDNKAPLIGEYCGRKVPPMIVSHGNALTIELGSYTDRIFGTFSVHYSPLINTCGGTLLAEEGTIASPLYPSPYPVNADCDWIVSTSPGNTASITFERFDLEYSEGCNEDYLELRKNHGGGDLIGVYCGSNIPSNYTIGSKVYIKFHSNSKTSGQGFMLHYEYLRDNDIQGEYGDLTSPLYPKLYEGAGEYRWRILISGEDNIVITINELTIPSYGDVNYNKLTIFDGYDNTAPILEQLHGALAERKTIQTSSSLVYIILTMDDSNTGSKFHMSWTKSSRNAPLPETEDHINCGANQTTLLLPGQVGDVKSPNFPDEYNDNLNCEWVYTTSMGRHLSLTFSEFNLEETPACFADSVSIYSADSPGNWRTVVDEACESSTVRGETNSSTYMKIKFKTDSSMTRKGFHGQVKSICGGLITDLSGEIGPVWLDAYPFRQRIIKCDWTIKVRPGRTIQLRFSNFNITNNNANCASYVVLRNGDSVEAPMLASGKYCGYEHEQKTDIETSSNALFVSYTSENRRYPYIFQSFKIYYEEKNYECGSTAKLTTNHKWEIINSPRFPSVSIPYSECVWIFTGPPGEILRIDFIDRFDLDYTDGCGKEVVEIRDGSSILSPSKGRFCGEKPATVKSSSNTMYIKYSTQLAEPRNGFKANVSIDVCGGTIMAGSGVVTSPGYPHMQVFPTGTVCEWRIIGPPRHVFLIKLEDLQLPQSETNCATKIDIEEHIPVNNSIAILKTLCGIDIEEDSKVIETSNNNFTIKLTFGKPDEWDQVSGNRGFRISYNSSRPMCGGKITTSEGYLTTPSYPRETSLRYCQWSIEVPDKSRRIRLELIDINEEKHRIGIYNDVRYQTLIASIPTGNSTAEKYYESVGNKLTIYIFLNRESTTHRFKARFTSDEQSLCGGDLSSANYELLSPALNRSYRCEWHYYNKIDLGNQNNLTYKSIYVTANVSSSVTRTRCRYLDPIITLQSPINNKGLIFQREICGNTQLSLRIPSTILDISAAKNNFQSLLFQLNWKPQPCGGIVRVGEASVNIINVPDFYNDTLDCAWILVIPNNNKVEIKMEGTFSLDCDAEYISIMQGLSQNLPPLGTYCKGDLLENRLVTHYPYMYVQYHSNVKNNTTIRLMAQTELGQCGGLLTSYQNIFSTPNYPKSYPPNTECAWEIRADLGFRVSLQFINRFIIEDKPNCTNDAVIIYDWNDDIYIEMARVCGRQAPPIFNSTYNRLKVIFRSNADSHHDGFKALWTPICGGNFVATDKEQILYSPGYPYHYPASMHCIYELSSQNNQKILLKFLEFELEGLFPECISDNLTLSAQNDYDYLSKIYCGNELPATVRSYDKLTLDFKSDRYLQRKGFKLSYSLYKCGGKINNITVISSSIDNDDYDANLNCTWHIEAPTNKIVVIKFLYFDLESHSECYNDYVALYDSRYVNENKRLALLCGYDNSTTVLRSTGTDMVLEFVTDSSLNYKGFKAAIYFSYSETAGCGGRINITGSRVIKSPLIGNVVYENFLDCHWSITSPPNTVIKITFSNFHIAPCKDINQTAIGYSKCDCDLVEIKDGLMPNSLLIGTYCGHTLPPQLITSDNMMSVRLSTDGEYTSSGFEAAVSIQQKICGESDIRVSYTPHRFKTPDYDKGSVPRGIHCAYRLTNAESYYQVRITIKNLELRPPVAESINANQCLKDKLVISSNPLNWNISHGNDLIINHQSDDFFSRLYFYESNIHLPNRFELCGHKEAIDFYVYGSTTINLITSPESDSGVHRGAEIEVAFVGFCGRNYTEPQGRIMSSYVTSSAETTRDDCYTLITAPENHTISAYFLNVIPEYWDENTYLEIYDGDKTSAKKLVSIHQEYEDNYPVFATGRYMLLHNHQNSLNRVTYDMNYVTTNKGIGCGGKLNNIIGAVTSPFYPNTYRHKSICEWVLETPVGTQLLIRFNTFDLGITCDQNYLQLVDSKGVVVRTFCSESPADFTSEDNYLKLVFYTTMNNSGRGWTANFIAINI